MPTLTAKDIDTVQKLYRDLDEIKRKRKTAALQMTSMMVYAKCNALGLEINDLSPEAQNAIMEIARKDLRVRAAKIVEQLHKLGCEAQL
jgi:cell division protein FtsB